MKGFKRVVGVILVFAMMFALSVGASAAASTMDITKLTIADTTAEDGLLNVEVEFTAQGADEITVIMSSQDLSSPSAIDSEQVVYINQVKAPASGKLAFVINEAKVALLKAAGKLVNDTLYVKMGGTDVLTPDLFSASISGEGGGTLPPVQSGVAVKGAVISWNNENNANVYLYAKATTMQQIMTDMVSATPISRLYSAVVDAPVADAAKFKQAFTFSNIPEGEYKLAVFKPRGTTNAPYAPKVVDVTVGATEVVVGDSVMWLYGDINNNGTVETVDAMLMLLRSVGNGDAFNDDQMMAADINNNGTVETVEAMQALLRSVGNEAPFFTAKP